MSDYVPPYPHRWTEELSPWKRVRLARRNVLAAFEDGLFEVDHISRRILLKHLFLCNSPQTVQDAFGTKYASFERKSPTMRHMLEPLIGDGLFISEGETWRRRRRIVAPVIHVSRLSEFAPAMIDTACEMADRWGELPEGAPVDVLSQMAQLTAEIICRAIFGRQLGAGRTREVVDGFSEFSRVVSSIDLPSLLGLPDWVPRFRHFAVARSVRRIHRVIDEIIAGYRDRPDSANTSVVGRLIDARDEETGEKLSANALRNEAVVIFMAGHETTANTLSFVWFLLSQAPDVEARLHAELDAVLGDRPPSLADVANLVYTRAIVEETLRLYPPIPILAREATRDETIAGAKVPKGSMVMVIPWLLHRHRKLWKKPDHFWPERFLPENGPAPSKWAYLPFSNGPRVCAGMAFGMTESILSVAILAQQFRLRLAAGHTVEPVCRVSLRPGETLPMTIHRRRAAPSAAATEALAACPFGHG